MASLKKSVDFNEYWHFLKREAELRGWSDAEFMRKCRIPRQRFYEFGKGRNLTGTYMVRVMEGLGLMVENIEKQTKRTFTDAQKRELRKDSWVAAHPNIIEAMIDYPALVDIVEAHIKMLPPKK